MDNYKLVFEKPEHLVHHFHDEKSGRLNGETRDYGNLREFVLPQDFLQQGRTLIFSDIKSRSVDLCTLGDTRLAHVEFKDFCNLLLWRPARGHVICIEPWGNLPDTENKPDIEFSQKAPWTVGGGLSKTIEREIKYL